MSPFVFSGKTAISSVADTPRWSKVVFTEKTVVHPREGLLSIAYKAEATRDGCTTTMRRLQQDVWRVVQHQQTLPPIGRTSS